MSLSRSFALAGERMKSRVSEDLESDGGVRVKENELMIHATIRMKMPAQKVTEGVEILRSVAERTRVQPGCIGCRIYLDAREENVSHKRSSLQLIAFITGHTILCRRRPRRSFGPQHDGPISPLTHKGAFPIRPYIRSEFLSPDWQTQRQL